MCPGVHCGTCRLIEESRQWRRSLGQRFDLPGGLIDFPCPINKPWIGEGEPTDEKQVKLSVSAHAGRHQLRTVADAIIEINQHEVDKFCGRFPLPGQQLTAIFKAAGIETTPGCQCRAHARQLDTWWCDLERAHPDAGYKELMTRFVASHGVTIVGWLTAEAIRSKVVPNPVRLWAAIKEVTQTEGAPP